MIMPNGAAAEALANAARGRFHSRIIAGTAFDSSWLSAPSRTIISAVAATSSCWYPLNRPSSISAATSTVVMRSHTILRGARET